MFHTKTQAKAYKKGRATPDVRRASLLGSLAPPLGVRPWERRPEPAVGFFFVLTQFAQGYRPIFCEQKKPRQGLHYFLLMQICDLLGTYFYQGRNKPKAAAVKYHALGFLGQGGQLHRLCSTEAIDNNCPAESVPVRPLAGARHPVAGCLTCTNHEGRKGTKTSLALPSVELSESCFAYPVF